MRTARRRNHKLTADVERLAKRGRDFRIKFNHEIVLFCEVIVSALYLIEHPSSEFISDNRIDHVDNPLPWQLHDVTIVRKVMSDFFNLSAILEDAVNR